MNDEEFKLKISKYLFSLYPFIYYLKGLSTHNVVYNEESGVILDNQKYDSLKSLKLNIINLATVDPNNSDYVRIDGDINKKESIKQKNEIYRFHQFIFNFINIIKFEYINNKNDFDTIYKIYYNYLLNKSKLNDFKATFKNNTSNEGIVIIITELDHFNNNLKKFNESKNNIINGEISNGNLLTASLYENDYKKIYTFKDFIAYLSILYKELNEELILFTNNFNVQIKIFDESYSKDISILRQSVSDDIKSNLKGFDVKDLKATQDIKSIYRKADSFINGYIDKKTNDYDERYKKIKNLDEKKKRNLKISLATFVTLLDTNNGSWKDDIINSGDYEDDLRQLQQDFSNILQILDYTKVEVKEDYYEIKSIYDKLKSIVPLLKANKRLSKEEYDLLSNFNSIISDLKINSKFKDEDNFKNELKKVENLYKELSTGENPIITKEKIEKVDVIRKDTIYFDTNIIVFKIILKYLIMLAVLLLFIIALLSFVSLFILVWDIIKYFITSFINPNLTKAFTIDYLTKNMIHCNKNNFDDDRYLIFTVQSQNISVFTLSAYILYLLLGLLIFYLMHVLYASSTRKFLQGSIYDIDKEGAIIIIFIIILLYSFTHLLLYTYIFKPFVYNQYKDYSSREQKVEELLDAMILIKSTQSGSTENQIIVDENFFEILFDPTRIDELNSIFLSGIKDNNASGCLEQKIIIYDIYIYLKEYISFDEINQKKFKEYCTNNKENKPLLSKDSNKRTTFLSMLNNSEVRMIKKYHEELDFYQNIPDDNIEYYNKLNKNINIKLKQINENIITYNKTLIPFFTVILYIIGIFFITVGLFYMVINYVLMGDAKMSEENKFNYYFVYFLYTIKTEIYDKIIKWLNK